MINVSLANMWTYFDDKYHHVIRVERRQTLFNECLSSSVTCKVKLYAMVYQSSTIVVDVTSTHFHWSIVTVDEETGQVKIKSAIFVSLVNNRQSYWYSQCNRKWRATDRQCWLSENNGRCGEREREDEELRSTSEYLNKAEMTNLFPVDETYLQRVDTHRYKERIWSFNIYLSLDCWSRFTFISWQEPVQWFIAPRDPMQRWHLTEVLFHHWRKAIVSQPIDVLKMCTQV